MSRAKLSGGEKKWLWEKNEWMEEILQEKKIYWKEKCEWEKKLSKNKNHCTELIKRAVLGDACKYPFI